MESETKEGSEEVLTNAALRKTASPAHYLELFQPPCNMFESSGFVHCHFSIIRNKMIFSGAYILPARDMTLYESPQVV